MTENPRARFATAEIQELYRQYQAGKSVRELGVEHGVTRNAIYKAFRRKDLARDQHPQAVYVALTGEQVAQIHHDYQSADLTVPEISRRYGVSRGRMLRAFHKAGLPVRSRSQRQVSLTAVQVGQMYAEYMASPEKSDDVAGKYGLCSARMYDAFRQAGLMTKTQLDEQRRVSEEETSPNGKCPALRGKMMCAECPCPVPPCKEGEEWWCGSCTRRRECACWNPEIRASHGWEKARVDWQHQQEEERQKRQRVERLLKEGWRRWKWRTASV